MFNKYKSNYGNKPFCLGANINNPIKLETILRLQCNLGIPFEILSNEYTYNYNINDGTNYNFIITIPYNTKAILENMIPKLEFIVNNL